MGLPAQVERDLKEIEEMEKRMSARNEEPSEEGSEAEPETDPTEAKSEEDRQEPTPTPAPETPSESPKAEAEPAKPKEDFEQKYLTLRGKYNAEVPQLHEQVKALTAQLETLKEQVSKPAEKPPEPKQYVTDEDKENFGEDLLDVQRRIAMEVAEKYQAQIAELKDHIGALETKLSETGGQVGQVSFEQRLRGTIPDFDEVNRDPRWIAWLDEVDPIVRGPRRTVAQKAFAEGDVEAVADYVKLFKQTLQPTQDNQQSNREVELERQVTPKRTANTPPATTAQQGAKTYTEAQAERVWKKVQDLSMQGRIEEAQKLEAEMTAAYLEGRVGGR